MPHLFDNLPLDMIQYEIFPYLDYDSRVTVNLMLPLVDRIRTPLKKDAAIQFNMTLSVPILAKYLRDVDTREKSGQQRNRAILKVYREIPKLFYVLEYNKKFREAVLERTQAFSDPSGHDYSNTTRHMKKTLPALCATVLDMATQRPFIRSVSTSFQIGWSAITNGNPLKVVTESEMSMVDRH